MSMEFTLNDLQRQRVEDHLALVEQVLRRSIKTNETVDGMGHDDLYQEGCIALCRAAVSYREEMGAFPAYARTVIRNYLLDRCREIQSARKNLPLLSLDAFAEMGAPEPVSPFHTEDLISDVSSDAHLNIVMSQGSAESETADAAKAIDSNSNHWKSPPKTLSSVSLAGYTLSIVPKFAFFFKAFPMDFEKK